MKFVVDRMLGRLARWLRLFGYDTLEIRKQENEDELLLKLAEDEDRILVSRDRGLIRKAEKKGIVSCLIYSSDVQEQIKEMHEKLRISLEPEMDRCTLCNSSIRKAGAEDMEIIREKEYVPWINTEFWICDNCGQVYWEGRHWENIKDRVEKLKKLLPK